MVRISRQRLVASRPGGRLRGNGSGKAVLSSTSPEAVYGAAGLLGMVLMFGIYFTWLSGREGSESTLSTFNNKNNNYNYNTLNDAASSQLRRTHPQLQIPDKNTDQYDALAQDILQTLDCVNLLNITHAQLGEKEEEFHFEQDDKTGDDFANKRHENHNRRHRRRRRRLEGGGINPLMPEHTDDLKNDKGHVDTNYDDNEREDVDPLDDDLNYVGSIAPSAQHLFCLAAADDMAAAVEDVQSWQSQMKCDAGRHRKSLLDLWNMARPEMEEGLLKKVLDMSYENTHTLIDQTVYLFDPSADTGLDYMIKHVNNKEKTVDDGGLYGLDHNLGPGRVFVDVGSGLGTTSMAISLLYPGTRIISIEVASPNWLLQELNWRCNADVLPNSPSTLMLAGMGPASHLQSFAKYLWKPDLTTATRSWTPASERNVFDVELSVHLKSWHDIRAMAEFQHVDVLNVDCGACEYNFIPALTDEEFDAIHTVMGGLHWGYIPEGRLPSSKRGRETHERLCRHENFAKTAKECCDIPDLHVVSSYPGEALVHDTPGIPKAGTVSDVAGPLCDDFKQWAKEKHLHDIPNDYGWFQISAVAEGY